MKRLFLVFAFFHLLVIIIVNTHGTLKSVYNFYFGREHRSVVLTQLEKIAYSKGIWPYASYTGTNSPYGFYAPNVSSPYLMTFTVYDAKGKQLGVSMKPKLRQQESNHRFALCSDIMQDKLASKQPNEILDNYLKVMFHQIGTRIMKDFPGAARVTTKVFVYDCPGIHEFVEGKQKQLQLVALYRFKN
jgi:hypothetical protein